RFYRPETEATRRNPGSGLGLPIARALVELHGGRIWVESHSGAGATFCIALPTGLPAEVIGRSAPTSELTGEAV
ncbi:MAG: PAS domain-containing sensor histidine kinase, partial [Chloroflexi bacterium]|nr:PAS domain-containing sensor histidine kinase [Chloroflexota bacterium]